MSATPFNDNIVKLFGLQGTVAAVGAISRAAREHLSSSALTCETPGRRPSADESSDGIIRYAGHEFNMVNNRVCCLICGAIRRRDRLDRRCTGRTQAAA